MRLDSCSFTQIKGTATTVCTKIEQSVTNWCQNQTKHTHNSIKRSFFCVYSCIVLLLLLRFYLFRAHKIWLWIFIFINRQNEWICYRCSFVSQSYQWKGALMLWQRATYLLFILFYFHRERVSLAPPPMCSKARKKAESRKTCGLAWRGGTKVQVIYTLLFLLSHRWWE